MRRKEEKKQSQAADSALGLTYGASGPVGGRGQRRPLSSTKRVKA